MVEHRSVVRQDEHAAGHGVHELEHCWVGFERRCPCFYERSFTEPTVKRVEYNTDDVGRFVHAKFGIVIEPVAEQSGGEVMLVKTGQMGEAMQTTVGVVPGNNAAEIEHRDVVGGQRHGVVRSSSMS
jgi:ribosomal protein S28E/S33